MPFFYRSTPPPPPPEDAEADRFAGHPGHLSQSQQSALDAFRAILVKADLLQLGKESLQDSHDEDTLLRFLRARKFDAPKALKQFASTEAWRKEHDVNGLYDSFDPVEFEDAKRFYPIWNGRRDKHGRPLSVYRIAALTPDVQTELFAVSPERRYERIIVLNEFMMRFVYPLLSTLTHEAGSGTPVSNVCSIIDLKGVSLSHMWNLKTHLQQASSLTTANYPETLDQTFVVNAPGFFSTVWAWVKPLFDEGTRKKIHILHPSTMTETLLQHIAASELPREYGGELDWTYGDTPSFDEEVAQAIGEGALPLPSGPLVFIADPGAPGGRGRVMKGAELVKSEVVVNEAKDVNGAINANGHAES